VLGPDDVTPEQAELLRAVNYHPVEGAGPMAEVDLRRAYPDIGAIRKLVMSADLNDPEVAKYVKKMNFSPEALAELQNNSFANKYPGAYAQGNYGGDVPSGVSPHIRELRDFQQGPLNAAVNAREVAVDKWLQDVSSGVRKPFTSRGLLGGASPVGSWFVDNPPVIPSFRSMEGPQVPPGRALDSYQRTISDRVKQQLFGSGAYRYEEPPSPPWEHKMFPQTMGTSPRGGSGLEDSRFALALDPTTPSKSPHAIPLDPPFPFANKVNPTAGAGRINLSYPAGTGIDTLEGKGGAEFDPGYLPNVVSSEPVSGTQRVIDSDVLASAFGRPQRSKMIGVGPPLSKEATDWYTPPGFRGGDPRRGGFLMPDLYTPMLDMYHGARDLAGRAGEITSDAVGAAGSQLGKLSDWASVHTPQMVKDVGAGVEAWSLAHPGVDGVITNMARHGKGLIALAVADYAANKVTEAMGIPDQYNPVKWADKVMAYPFDVAGAVAQGALNAWYTGATPLPVSVRVRAGLPAYETVTNAAIEASAPRYLAPQSVLRNKAEEARGQAAALQEWRDTAASARPLRDKAEQVFSSMFGGQ
jgi:hypothetical protein